MNERERLIELMEQATNGSCHVEDVADYLLENGVVVPPCKVGDTVYLILYAPISRKHYIKETSAGNIISINGYWYVEHSERNERLLEFGVKAFVNKEEAEQALKETKI